MTNWLLRLLGADHSHSSDYERALGSAHWRQLRAKVVRRARNRCEACKRKGPLELHHLHYRTLGRERQKDVVLLCPDCHRKADRKRRQLRVVP